MGKFPELVWPGVLSFLFISPIKCTHTSANKTVGHSGVLLYQKHLSPTTYSHLRLSRLLTKYLQPSSLKFVREIAKSESLSAFCLCLECFPFIFPSFLSFDPSLPFFNPVSISCAYDLKMFTGWCQRFWTAGAHEVWRSALSKKSGIDQVLKWMQCCMKYAFILPEKHPED